MSLFGFARDRPGFVALAVLGCSAALASCAGFLATSSRVQPLEPLWAVLATGFGVVFLSIFLWKWPWMYLGGYAAMWVGFIALTATIPSLSTPFAILFFWGQIWLPYTLGGPLWVLSFLRLRSPRGRAVPQPPPGE